MAISKFDQFDFLIDIVPRDEIKAPPSRPAETGKTSSGGVLPDQVGRRDVQGNVLSVIQENTAKAVSFYRCFTDTFTVISYLLYVPGPGNRYSVP